ncbi:MAG: SDR family oxidoreductase [Proteobacteria bacterium]|nr:SDR family oxidoreductase [Pseudomonadota bacterium]
MTTDAKTARRVLLVTGGSRGIGAACCRGAALQGWDVAVNYARDAVAAEAVAVAVRSLGRRAITVQADVADEGQVLAMFKLIDAELGPLAGLVNSAGIVDQPLRLAQMSGARLRRMFDTNIFGSVVCAREAVRRMSTRDHGGAWASAGGGRGGAIVNLGSAASRLGSPAQYVDYAASKGAIDSFTLGLAREVAAEGIRVNAVRPGIIDTEMHASGGAPDRAQAMAPQLPMQRAGRAEEVAAAVLWLLSDEAGYTTGALLDVTGGR